MSSGTTPSSDAISQATQSSIPIITLVFNDIPSDSNSFNVGATLDPTHAGIATLDETREGLERSFNYLAQSGVITKSEVAHLADKDYPGSSTTGWAEASKLVASHILDRLGYTADTVEVQTDLSNLSLSGIYVSEAQLARNAVSDDIPLTQDTSSNNPTFTIIAFDGPPEANVMQIDVTISSGTQTLEEHKNATLEAARLTMQDTLRKTAKAWDKVSIQNYARQAQEPDTVALEYHLRQVAYMTLRDWPQFRKYAQSGIVVDTSRVTFPEYLGEFVYSRSFPPQQIQDGWRASGEM